MPEMYTHEIGWAVKQMWNGEKVCRASWNGPGQWIGIQRSDDEVSTMDNYVYLKNAQGRFIPWHASQGDLLATDWQLAEIP